MASEQEQTAAERAEWYEAEYPTCSTCYEPRGNGCECDEDEEASS